MRPTKDESWMRVADEVARRSRCRRNRHGAVIVDASNHIIATGFNGPPRGWLPEMRDGEPTEDWWLNDCGHWCERGFKGPNRYTVRSYDDCPALHAEMNALMWSDRSRREGGTLYVNGLSCFTCAKAVANSGLARVVMRDDQMDYRVPSATIELLERCGLEVNLVGTRERTATSS